VLQITCANLKAKKVGRREDEKRREKKAELKTLAELKILVVRTESVVKVL
jgi:hypothetical protein